PTMAAREARGETRTTKRTPSSSSWTSNIRAHPREETALCPPAGPDCSTPLSAGAAPFFEALAQRKRQSSRSVRIRGRRRSSSLRSYPIQRRSFVRARSMATGSRSAWEPASFPQHGRSSNANGLFLDVADATNFSEAVGKGVTATRRFPLGSRRASQAPSIPVPSFLVSVPHTPPTSAPGQLTDRAFELEPIPDHRTRHLHAEAVRSFATCNPFAEESKRRGGFRSPRQAARRLVELCLSDDVLNDVDQHCPLIAVPSDVARAGLEPRSAYTSIVQRMLQVFRGAFPDSDPDRNHQAHVILNLCVGGIG